MQHLCPSPATTVQQPFAPEHPLETFPLCLCAGEAFAGCQGKAPCSAMQGPGERTSGGLWGAGMGCALVFLEKGSSSSGVSTGLLLLRPGSGGNTLQSTLSQGFWSLGSMCCCWRNSATSFTGTSIASTAGSSSLHHLVSTGTWSCPRICREKCIAQG